MSKSKIVLSVLIGAAAGAIAGVLFAPDSGKNTRSKISKKTCDIGNNIKDKFSDLVDGIAEKFERTKDEGEELLNKGKAKASAIKTDIRNSMS